MRHRTRKPVGMLWLMGGVAAGVGVGWLTAPRRGDWLRNQIRQKLGHWRRVGRRRLEKQGRDLSHRVHGGVAELRSVWSGREHYVDANTLVDQVHSQIGREFAETLSHVNLNAVDHTVYLHGYVRDADERDRLIAAIHGIEGVRDVSAAELRVAAEAPEDPAPQVAPFPESDTREASAPAPPARTR
ncbi:MAG TPA: BON domain-containing protein, partial [Terriglobales bacterium]|nr:BON domain-containing protein [Terriglobales bacterium]